MVSNLKIINALRQFKQSSASDFGILEIGVFGSTARGGATYTSDVDVVVKLKKQDLFNIIGIKQELEEILKSSVDVISYRESMNKFLKRIIDREAVYV